MRAALVEDLARLTGLQVTVTTDPRFPLAAPPSVRVVPLARRGDDSFGRLLAEHDAVWLVAPESGGCLERLARRVERAGGKLLGPSAAAIALAGDKRVLGRRLAAAGLPVPPPAMPPFEFPLVVKPARGAGGEGVALACFASELTRALECARAADPRGHALAQRWVPGVPASVSLVTDGQRAQPLAVNRQHVRPGIPFTYEGGETPLAHPLAARAVERALEACATVPGLRGYVGVDVVLTDHDAIVLEINPRLTTSYLGIRRALDGNPAELALEAALGRLPAPTAIRLVRRVHFDAGGAILEQQPLRAWPTTAAHLRAGAPAVGRP